MCICIILKKNISYKIIQNSFYSVLDQALGLGANFVVTVLLARYLGAEDLGTYSLALTLSGIFAIATNFGTITILARESAKSSKKASLYLGNALGIKFFISLPFFVLTLAISVYLAGYPYGTAKIIALVAAVNIFNTSIGYVAIVLTSMHRNDLVLRVNLASKFLTILLVCVLLNLGFGLGEILVSYIAINITMFLYVFSVAKELLPRFGIRFDRKFNLRFILMSLPLVATGAAEFISLRVDVIFIANMLSREDVGFYSASYNIFLAASLIPLALTKIYFPNFVTRYSEDREKAFALFATYAKLFFLYSIAFGFVFYFFSNQIVGYIYGDKFSSSISLLELLSLALVMISLNRLCNCTLLAAKENSYYFRITLIGMLTNLILNYLLIGRIGAVGAVIATIATELIVLVLGISKIIKLR